MSNYEWPKVIWRNEDIRRKLRRLTIVSFDRREESHITLQPLLYKQKVANSAQWAIRYTTEWERCPGESDGRSNGRAKSWEESIWQLEQVYYTTWRDCRTLVSSKKGSKWINHHWVSTNWMSHTLSFFVVWCLLHLVFTVSQVTSCGCSDATTCIV